MENGYGFCAPFSLSLYISLSLTLSLSCIYLYQPSLFSVVAEDLTPEIANGQLPRAQHSRAHTSSSLSGHCTLLLDNFLAHFLEVAELSLGDVLSLDCAENLLDALLVLNLVFPSEPTPERLNGI